MKLSGREQKQENRRIEKFCFRWTVRFASKSPAAQSPAARKTRRSVTVDAAESLYDRCGVKRLSLQGVESLQGEIGDAMSVASRLPSVPPEPTGFPVTIS